MSLRISTYLLALALLATLVLTGCEVMDETVPEPEPTAASVFVANQGNFSDDNGSVTVYDAETGDTAQDAIIGLGTIIQSLALFDGRLYVMSNTAGHVDIFEVTTLVQDAQVTGIDGPRYLVQVNPGKAYVTQTGDFAGEQGFVTAIDLSTDEIITQIEVSGNPEGIAVAGNRAYVATGAWGATSEVEILDTEEDALLQTIDVNCHSPREVFSVANQYALVVCTGNGDVGGALRVLNGSGAILHQIDVDEPFSSSTSGNVAFYSADAGELYVTTSDNTVLRFTVSQSGMLSAPEVLGPFGGEAIGTLAYDPPSQQLYLGRPNQGDPFTVSGRVTIHDREGAFVDVFDAGIAPAHIVLRGE